MGNLHCSLGIFSSDCVMCPVADGMLLLQVMHKVILPHFDVDKSPGDRTFIYGCENDHG